MKKEENGVLEQTEDEKRRKTEQERKAVAPIENNGEEKRMGEEKQFEEDKPIGGIVEPEISGEQNKMPNKMS